MKGSAIVLALMITSAVSLHIKLTEESHTMGSASHRHHAYTKNARQNVAGQDTTNIHEWLIDTQLVVPLTLGDKQTNVVLDSTSYDTWLQSKNQAGVCNGCATGTTPFACEGSCSLTTTALPAAASFGGRVNEVVLVANELANVNLKNIQIGVSTTITDTTSSTLLKDRGVLGLAYGSNNKNYDQNSEAQLPPAGFAVNAALNEKFNLLKLLSKQNHGLVTEPTFALKLEDSLKVLTLGKPEGYFSLDQGQVYDNQGTQFWQLQLTEFSYGPFDDEVTPPAHPAAHPGHRMLVNSLFPNPAAGSYKFSFDTTTKFLTGPAALLTNLVTILNRDSPSGSRSNCVAPTVVGDVVVCTCTDAKSVNGFKPLSFRFNKKKFVHRIQPANFVHFNSGKCYLNIKLIEDGADVTLGSSFLKDNYVAFRQATNDIHVSTAYPVNPSNLHIQPNNRIAHIVVGLLLLIAALAALLSILKQIGVVPPAPVKEVPQQQPPQQTTTVYYAQPQPVYNVVVPQPQYQVQPALVGQPIYGQTLSNRSRHIPGGVIR